MAKMTSMVTLVMTLIIFQQPVQALALYELTLNSSLNQNLDARIPIQATADEAGTLKLSVARQSDSTVSSAWPGIKAKLIQGGKGMHYIQLSSDEVIREPVLGFVLELNWSTGKIYREYSLIIDLQ